ncbi:electron transfer flavoprotein subunit alpha/FixB family protein [Curvibacter sp. CHRR-16]|uniref:electron transfer flavoprotein subunit alpha/FixB family protein n=1 Tax=Curvibacter sp. CHRR-16 TaxID=2835872 RepID=UPI001BDAEE2C|nr:electron transfer flavoprotein subunit alpha/FixB family protein [Curvibacter sp. CHRR-16]MBT0570708.1 electron transfer flavoprotein subunit alpha/FixB family protein [Curvibacter sp. CHRR-16]
MSTGTMKRVNPRRPAYITPAGMRRIVLGAVAGAAQAGVPGAAHGVARGIEHSASKPLRASGPFARCILVVSHSDKGVLDERARQALAAAAILASSDTEVVLVVLGPCQEDWAALGADRCVLVPQGLRDAHVPTQASVWLGALYQQLQPLYVLLPDRDADADLGRRLAVEQGLPLAGPVVEIQPAGTPADVRCRVRASAGHDALCTGARVLMLAGGVAVTELPFVGLGVVSVAGQGDSSAWPNWPTELARMPGLQDMGVQAGQAQTLALEEADFILSAGNGVQDLALFHELADALGAATGASRVAVDDGRFPRAKQIGATGKTVQASAYVAIGISGAVQHLQGIKDCRHVIAVNTDSAAPIGKRANVLAVAESSEFMRALLALVQAKRGLRAGANAQQKG